MHATLRLLCSNHASLDTGTHPYTQGSSNDTQRAQALTVGALQPSVAQCTLVVSAELPVLGDEVSGYAKKCQVHLMCQLLCFGQVLRQVLHMATNTPHIRSIPTIALNTKQAT